MKQYRISFWGARKPELKTNEAEIVPEFSHIFSSHAQLDSDLSSHEVKTTLSIHSSTTSSLGARNAKILSPGSFLSVLF